MSEQVNKMAYDKIVLLFREDYDQSCGAELMNNAFAYPLKDGGLMREENYS